VGAVTEVEWPLESSANWADVDYDMAVWVEVPFTFSADTWPDHRAWARDVAEACWDDSGLTPGEHDVDKLALLLAVSHENSVGKIYAHRIFLHVPDPRMAPVPAGLGIWRSQGDREETLRALAKAASPFAVEPPIVEEFSTERLGKGLRTVHYGRQEDAALYMAVHYAFRVEKYETDLNLFAYGYDLGRMYGTLDDLDELARRIDVVPDETDGALSG
jgi:hypothetical protein